MVYPLSYINIKKSFNIVETALLICPPISSLWWCAEACHSPLDLPFNAQVLAFIAYKYFRHVGIVSVSSAANAWCNAVHGDN